MYIYIYMYMYITFGDGTFNTSKISSERVLSVPELSIDGLNLGCHHHHLTRSVEAASSHWVNLRDSKGVIL